MSSRSTGSTSTARLDGVVEHGDDGKIYLRLGSPRGPEPEPDFLVEEPEGEGCEVVTWRGEHPDPLDVHMVLKVEYTLRDRARPYEHGPYVTEREEVEEWRESGSKAARAIAREGYRLVAKQGLSLEDACARLKARHSLDYIEVVESFQADEPHVRRVIRFLHGGRFIEDIDLTRDLPAFDTPRPGDAGGRTRCKGMKCKEKRRMLDLGAGPFRLY